MIDSSIQPPCLFRGDLCLSVDFFIVVFSSLAFLFDFFPTVTYTRGKIYIPTVSTHH